MTRPFTADELFFLSIDARAQFDWAREDGDPCPEGIAFKVDGRLIAGHSRKGIESALDNALSYLNEEFAGAAHNPIPSRVLMVTEMTKDGKQPKLPSQRLRSDLHRVAGHTVLITIIGADGSSQRELRL